MSIEIANIEEQQNEEQTGVIHSITDELIEQVMEKCFKNYLKKQTVKFVVQCAYDALIKFFSIEFYYHPPVPDIQESIWIPDEPIDPSPKDTWASGAFRVYKSREHMQKEKGLKITEVIEEKEGEANEKLVTKDESLTNKTSRCECKEICNCEVSTSELIKKIETQMKKKRIKHYPTPASSINREFTEENDHQLPSDHRQSSSLIKQGAIPKITGGVIKSSSQVDDGMLKTFPNTVSMQNKSDKKIRKKIKENQTERKNRKLDVPSAIERGSKANLIKLEPIRVNTRMSTKPEEVKKKKK